jgi:hypothetical protein
MPSVELIGDFVRRELITVEPHDAIHLFARDAVLASCHRRSDRL